MTRNQIQLRVNQAVDRRLLEVVDKVFPIAKLDHLKHSKKQQGEDCSCELCDNIKSSKIISLLLHRTRKRSRNLDILEQEECLPVPVINYKQTEVAQHLDSLSTRKSLLRKERQSIVA